MRTSSSPRRLAATSLALVVAGSLLLAGCSDDASPKESTPAPPTSDATEGPATPSPTTDPTPEGPTSIDAGTVTADSPATVTGTGPATVEFTLDKVDPVVEFSCADCTDTVDVTLAEPAISLWRTTGPVDGAWLSRPFSAMPPTSSLEIDVDGTWTLSISSIDSLPTTTGPQSGHGPGVAKLDQAATQLDVTFTPRNEADLLNLVVYDAVTGRETAREVMSSTTLSATVDATLPGTVLVLAEGDWTITPR